MNVPESIGWSESDFQNSGIISPIWRTKFGNVKMAIKVIFETRQRAGKLEKY